MSEDAPVNTGAVGWPGPDSACVDGTEDADQIAPLGDRGSRVAGSVICSTSSTDPAFLVWRGNASLGTRGADPGDRQGHCG